MKLFKKVMLVLLGVLLTLLTIFLVNTFRLGHTQIDPGERVAVEWDRDAMLYRYSQSITYKTISGDDGFARDTTEFVAFLDFIEESYPLVHYRLERILFNEYTPLYYWEGTDSSLDPILLMGHYDVVPIDSTDIDGWEYEPFSGAIADGYVWGRGTLDNKFNVMALLETAEYLLAKDYSPSRSIYLSFGHDEEIGGAEGAMAVSRYFQQQGVNLYYVLDEGGAIVSGAMPVDNPIAMIGTAEKGYLSLELVARTSGGHSSQPPHEMAVTMLSEALLKLYDNQFPARLDGATEDMFDSIGSKLPFLARMMYGNRWMTERFFKSQLVSDHATAPMVRTTVAPTILRAGVKDNVLPNEARAVVNFRLLPGDSFETIRDHVQNVIDNDNIAIREYGTIQTVPSRVSSVNTSIYRKLQQAIMDQYRDVYVAPYLVSGATDSRHFSNLTDQIFRFAPMKMNADELAIIHGTNERVRVESFENAIDFYVNLIQASTE